MVYLYLGPRCSIRRITSDLCKLTTWTSGFASLMPTIQMESACWALSIRYPYIKDLLSPPTLSEWTRQHTLVVGNFVLTIISIRALACSLSGLRYDAAMSFRGYQSVIPSPWTSALKSCICALVWCLLSSACGIRRISSQRGRNLNESPATLVPLYAAQSSHNVWAPLSAASSTQALYGKSQLASRHSNEKNFDD